MECAAAQKTQSIHWSTIASRTLSSQLTSKLRQRNPPNVKICHFIPSPWRYADVKKTEKKEGRMQFDLVQYRYIHNNTLSGWLERIYSFCNSFLSKCQDHWKVLQTGVVAQKAIRTWRLQRSWLICFKHHKENEAIQAGCDAFILSCSWCKKSWKYFSDLFALFVVPPTKEVIFGSGLLVCLSVCQELRARFPKQGRAWAKSTQRYISLSQYEWHLLFFPVFESIRGRGWWIKRKWYLDNTGKETGNYKLIFWLSVCGCVLKHCQIQLRFQTAPCGKFLHCPAFCKFRQSACWHVWITYGAGQRHKDVVVRPGSMHAIVSSALQNPRRPLLLVKLCI